MSVAGVSSLVPLTSLVVLNTTFQFASRKSTCACPVYSSPGSDKGSQANESLFHISLQARSGVQIVNWARKF